MIEDRKKTSCSFIGGIILLRGASRQDRIEYWRTMNEDRNGERKDPLKLTSPYPLTRLLELEEPDQRIRLLS